MLRYKWNIYVEFLAAIFKQGLEYNTINGYRSAISAYHVHINNKPVGEHPEVSRLMRGVSNERPPQPRYCSTWDINTVLKYIQSMGPNANLSNRDISIKTAILLAITSSHRGKELHHLRVHLMNVLNSHTTFHFNKKLKTTKTGEKLPTSTVRRFSGDTLLCPCNTLDDYLARTREWRITDFSSKLVKPDQLFLSSIEPHQRVS